jgi:NADPH:quinone reductase-like Zn-dependent oxidoreductase
MIKAVTYARTGGPEVLEVSEIAAPEPGAGEIRITVLAAAANLIDVKLRRGDFPFPQEFPVVVGFDGAGVVETVGADVRDVQVGDPVFGVGRGLFAQRAVLTTWQAKPAALDAATAAAIVTVGETAVRGLAHTGVAANQTILIHGATGGVGAIATQLAVRQGLTVIGTVAPADFGYASQLGAIPVAYGPGWLERVRAAAPQGVAGVLDAAGAGVLADSIQLTGSAATVVTLADMSAESFGVLFTGNDPDDRRYDSYPMLADLLVRGELKVRVARTYGLDQARELYADLERGGNAGKLVLTPNN